MKNLNWIWHHIPYVLIGVVSVYLITEPGRHESAPFVLYLLFLPLPMLLLFRKIRSVRKTK